jgi:F-type H+-transporting ATPase subunit b
MPFGPLLPFLTEEESDPRGLIEVNPGLMVWTLVTFAIVFFILRKFAFGRIAGLLEERRRVVQENLAAAEHARDEARRLLEEYKAQLAQSRQEAAGIIDRARRTADEDRRRMAEEIAAERERGIAQAQLAIQTETRQSLDRIKTEVADLTLAATEKVLGRALDEREQRRLIDEALRDVDFARLQGQAGGGR